MKNTMLITSGGINIDYINKISRKISIKSGKLGVIDLIYKLCTNREFRSIVFKKDKYEYYGHDHLYYSFLFNRDFNIIEDGLLNYSKTKRRFPLNLLLKNQVPGSGRGVEKVFLSGLESVPHILLDKVKINTIQDVWINLNENEKSSINDFFNVNLSEGDIENLLLTQPISEYKIIEERDKIDIYKGIYNEICNSSSCGKVYIKPHPRETTKYKEIFPNAIVLDSSCPSELLSLNSKNIKNVYTIYSTSLYAFNQSKQVMYGTTINKHLSDRVGVIKGWEG
ncbi:glycosyltransferase family 52 [Vibrio cyclitrophicus]|uniref:glycosyltransferase family 52 n=1 Tax=Vibrio cyclitrophicus TaxID=47951 RepID=UPI0012FFDBDB|nr:glycosyltransferase family 52 [Vibrio cyclitrophicus]